MKTYVLTVRLFTGEIRKQHIVASSYRQAIFKAEQFDVTVVS